MELAERDRFSCNGFLCAESFLNGWAEVGVSVDSKRVNLSSTNEGKPVMTNPR